MICQSDFFCLSPLNFELSPIDCTYIMSYKTTGCRIEFGYNTSAGGAVPANRNDIIFFRTFPAQAALVYACHLPALKCVQVVSFSHYYDSSTYILTFVSAQILTHCANKHDICRSKRRLPWRRGLRSFNRNNRIQQYGDRNIINYVHYSPVAIN